MILNNSIKAPFRAGAQECDATGDAMKYKCLAQKHSKIVITHKQFYSDLCIPKVKTMSEQKGRPSYLLSVLGNKCPRCREGYIFDSKNAYALKKSAYIKMPEKCPVCSQPTEIEVGFYYGTSYVSYALTVAYSVATFIAWWVLLGFSIYDNSIFYWLGFNSISMLLLQPVFMRLSRSMWLSWFVKYDADWKEHPVGNQERVIEEQMGNW